MTSLDQFVAVKVNGEQISLAEALRLAGWHGQLHFIKRAADVALIRQEAAELGVEASDDELQESADDFRLSKGLSEPAAVEEWLTANHLSFPDWERLLENDILTRKLRDAVTDPKVEQYFAENRLSFDAATISQIVVGSEEIARELIIQISEEGADFHKLARRYSMDDATRPAGGYVGAIARKDLDASAAAAVFSARAGYIVGPLKTEQGWVLIRVHGLQAATLDGPTRERIKSLLFEEWLSRQRSKAQVVETLLEGLLEADDEAYPKVEA